MRTVSCCAEIRWCHVGQETIREKFPAAMKHNGAMPDRKPIRKQFPAEVKHDGALPTLSFRAESRNLPAKSFLSR